MDIDTLTLAEHGAQRFRGAVANDLEALRSVLAGLPSDQAGLRLREIEGLGRYLDSTGPIGALPASFMEASSRPVRAILFDKTSAANWSLAWHQDRTICVKRRVEVEGYGPWSMKAGMQHVAPPFDLLSRMVTVRVHLDDVPADNAPLLIAPGSHRSGRVAVDKIEVVVREGGVKACLAEAGDVWLYSTPILHASEVAERPARRRVLQIDYAAEDLPDGLEWLGV
jgi:hypothetical protein